MSVVLATQNLRADGDVVTEGGIKKMNITDSSQSQLLTDILKELKKINLYNAIAHDVVINNSEVE
jgi:hypothetical protein